MSLGAAISYFTLFSLAPMLLVVIGVAGIAFGRDAVQGAVVAELTGLIGPEAAQGLETMLASASDVGSGVLGTTIGVLTFLLIATGALGELQSDLNLIWKATPQVVGIRGFLKTRVVSLALIIGVGLLLLVSLVLDAGLSAGRMYLETRFPDALTFLALFNRALALLMSILLFGMIFKFLPAVPLSWGDVAIGAVVTGLLFTVGKSLIGLYLGQSGIASAYGAAASIITILLWIYYSSLILLFGAEFTKAFAESYGTRSNRASAARGGPKVGQQAARPDAEIGRAAGTDREPES